MIVLYEVHLSKGSFLAIKATTAVSASIRAWLIPPLVGQLLRRFLDVARHFTAFAFLVGQPCGRQRQRQMEAMSGGYATA